MICTPVGWFKLALQLQGSVLPSVLPRILLCSGFGLIISILYYYGFSLPEQIFGNVISNVAYNLVLGLLLVFRTNTAYDRYWEGRKVWGGIIMNTLNLGRKIKIAVLEVEPIDKEKKIAALKLLTAFAIATKLHLRHSPINYELKSLVSQSQYEELQTAKNTSLKILLWMGNYLKQEQINNRLTMDELIYMNYSLDGMTEAWTGCERISKTPIPLAYAIYLKRLLLIYCFVLPLQVVHDLHWWTAPIIALITFILFGIEEIGHKIENPFGEDPNDLPLDEICTTLTTNLEDITA